MLASRGATIQRFEHYLFGPKPIWHLDNFKYILLHVGTNNLYLNTADEYGKLMERLLSNIFAKYEDCIVLLTSIMPRPADAPNTRPVARMYNLELIKIADPRVGPQTSKDFIIPGVNVFYVNLAKCFVDSSGKVIRNMFTRDDGLHLSRQGNTTMKYKLISVFNNVKTGNLQCYIGKLPSKMVHEYTK